MNKLLTATLIILMVSVVFLYFWGVPPIQRYMKNQDRISQLKDLVEAQKESVSQMKDLKERISDQYQEPLNKVAAALPAYADTPSLLQFLEKTARENGVVLAKVGKISVGGGAQQKSSEPEGESAGSKVSIKKMTLHISVNGDYNSLNSFLLNLERNARLIEITNLNTSQSDKGNQPQLPQYDLTLKTSFY